MAALITGMAIPETAITAAVGREAISTTIAAVNNVNVAIIHNVYRQRVVNKVTVTHVSYNGGPGGTAARPTAAQVAAERGRHITATSTQLQHEKLAKADRQQFASVNHGRPPVAATPKPGAFKTLPPAAGRATRNQTAAHSTNKMAAKTAPAPTTSRNSSGTGAYHKQCPSPGETESASSERRRA